MTFQTRLLALCGVLAGLLALLVVGILFSPERVQARTSARPLLPGISPEKIDAIDITAPGGRKISLRRGGRGWETPSGARTYPASADRINLFLRTVTGLQRTSLVSRDPGHLSELGLSTDTARILVLHQAGAPDAGLLVGKRVPSGDADYVQVRGESAVYLARGSLAFFLAQDQPSWYELHVLPDDVQGTTIASIAVNGDLRPDDTAAGGMRGGYTLRRQSADKLDQWLVGTPEQPADRVTAGAMAGSLALLEGVDFGETTADGAVPLTRAGRLDVTVTTFQGKRYSLVVRRGPQSGDVLITTDWSPWTYVTSALALRRAVLPESRLTAASR